jgi:hypothetical protein
MSSPQSQGLSSQADSPAVEEIKTTLYVDSARLKVVSQETKIHPVGAVSALREESARFSGSARRSPRG